MTPRDNSRFGVLVPSAWALKSRRVTPQDKTRTPVRDRTGQVAVLVPGGDRLGPTEAAAETAALRRRGLRGAAGKRPALEFGGDKEKFLVKFFSKNLRGVEQSSTALRGLQGP